MKGMAGRQAQMGMEIGRFLACISYLKITHIAASPKLDGQRTPQNTGYWYMNPMVIEASKLGIILCHDPWQAQELRSEASKNWLTPD